MTSSDAKYFRAPWTKESVLFLREWWPHWGTWGLAPMLGLKRSQVKAKAFKIGLHLLPKTERLCIDCKREKQYVRVRGLCCCRCRKLRRKKNKGKPRSLKWWVGAITRTARYRANGVSNLTTEYMMRLWLKQNGRCFYTGLVMRQPIYGAGRNQFSPSIGRLDPTKSYVKGNVVWATWICNAGKSDLSVEEYVRVCRKVVNHFRGKLRRQVGTLSTNASERDLRKILRASRGTSR